MGRMICQPDTMPSSPVVALVTRACIRATPTHWRLSFTVTAAARIERDVEIGKPLMSYSTDSLQIAGHMVYTLEYLGRAQVEAKLFAAIAKCPAQLLHKSSAALVPTNGGCRCPTQWDRILVTKLAIVKRQVAFSSEGTIESKD